MQLQLTEIEIFDVIDSDTIDYYAMGKKNDIVEVNRELFSGGQEFIYKDYYFAFLNVNEDGNEVTFLHPYRANVSRHKWKYAFGCQDSKGKLHWFFKGVSKASDRTTALAIYDQLVEYCQTKSLKPFLIKK